MTIGGMHICQIFLVSLLIFLYYIYPFSVYLFLFPRVSLSVSVIVVLLSLIVIYIHSETLLCIDPPYKEFYIAAKYDLKPLPPWLEKADCSQRQHPSDIQLF
jgi:hypothetical protein